MQHPDISFFGFGNSQHGRVHQNTMLYESPRIKGENMCTVEGGRQISRSH